MINKQLLLIFLVLMIAVAIVPVNAATPPTVYVDTDGSGDYDCDGTDDHVQINQALAFVGSNAGYTTVHLNGSNTYWINATLNMYENTIFEGDSDAEIKLINEAGWNNIIPLISNTTSGSDNFTIQGFEIDGNSENQSVPLGDTYYNMMYFYNCFNITVDNMRLEWGTSDGLKVQFVEPYIGDSAYITFTNNSVYKLGHDACYVIKLNNVTVAHNDIFTRTNSAVRLSKSGNATVYNNTIHSEIAGWSTGPGIELDKTSGYTSENVKIYNNTLYTLNGAGILFLGRDDDDVIRGKDVHIHHNTFYNVGQYGSDTGYSNAAIVIGQFNNTIIENNIIDDGGHAGIKYYIIPSYHHMDASFTTIIRNNIIINSNNNAAAGLWNYNDTDHTFISEYNCIYNNTGGAYNGTNITYSNDLQINPLFYNDPNHNYYLNSTVGTWTGTGWEIMNADSPCIDGGKPSSDYSLEPFPNGHRINIGRYGGTVYASKSLDDVIYISPTLPNNSITTNNYVEVNSSIKANNLADFIWNWNGHNYTFLNSSTVLHISFDNNSAIGDNSTVVVDVSSQGNNGSFVNGTSGNWTTAGDWNGAMSLDGVNDNVSLPMINISGAFTMSIRIYPTEDNSEYDGVFGSGQGADASARYLFSFYNKKIIFEICNGSIAYKEKVEYTVPNLYEWYNATVTWDGTTNANGLKLYVDDILRDQDTIGFTAFDDYQNWYIGRDTHGTNRHFPGMVDECRVDLYAWDSDKINQSSKSNLYKYNSTFWYFWSNQTGLSEGEYNYQIFANNVESNYRVVTLDIGATGEYIQYNPNGLLYNEVNDVGGITYTGNTTEQVNTTLTAASTTGIVNISRNTPLANEIFNITVNSGVCDWLNITGGETNYSQVQIEYSGNSTSIESQKVSGRSVNFTTNLCAGTYRIVPLSTPINLPDASTIVVVVSAFAGLVFAARRWFGRRRRR